MLLWTQHATLQIWRFEIWILASAEPNTRCRHTIHTHQTNPNQHVHAHRIILIEQCSRYTLQASTGLVGSSRLAWAEGESLQETCLSKKSYLSRLLMCSFLPHQSEKLVHHTKLATSHYLQESTPATWKETNSPSSLSSRSPGARNVVRSRQVADCR